MSSTKAKLVGPDGNIKMSQRVKLIHQEFMDCILMFPLRQLVDHLDGPTTGLPVTQ